MSVIFAFVAGALSFFSPCIFPLVPAYVAHLTGTPIRENRIWVGKREILMRSLAFIGGFSVIFVLMGATASAIGQMLVQYREFIEKLAGLFIIIFGLQMAGILSFRLLMKEKRWDTSTSKAKGWLSSVFVGMAFAAGWTPCVGLTLSSILLLASSAETLYSGMVLLLVYSLGLGVPFLLLSLAMTKSLQIIKNVNRWLPLLSKVNGWLLVVLGVLLYTGQMAKISALLSSYSVFFF